MKDNKIILNPNELVQFINNNPEDFTKDDLVRFIEARGIKMINFRYAGEEGKLRSYRDKDLSERLYGKEEELHKIVLKYIHCM